MAEGITQSGIMIAGVGSRTQELYHPGEPEKGMLFLAQPNPSLGKDRDGGVRLVDLILANHVLGLPDLQKVTMLVNPNSSIPQHFDGSIETGGTTNTEKLLRRQGRLDLAPPSMAEEIEIAFAIQEPKSEGNPYGTAWAAHLLMAGMDLKPDEQILLTTGDDLLFDPAGTSAIAELTLALKNSSVGSTAAMQVYTVPAEQESLYGAARSEVINGEQYLVDMVEAESTRASLALPGQVIELDKNISTYVVDGDFRRLNDGVATTEPTAASNEGERQITDTLTGYRAFADRRLLVARASNTYTYLDLGKAANIRKYRDGEFAGLRLHYAMSPRWGNRRPNY